MLSERASPMTPDAPQAQLWRGERRAVRAAPKFTPGLLELIAREVHALGLGGIVALCCRAPTPYQIRYNIFGQVRYALFSQTVV
jgi:hypothetical protein